jgi:hypothetical protein
LLDRLKNRNPRGKGGAADHQSTHGRMGLRTARKEETSRLENISIESSGRNKLYLWVEVNCVFTGKFLYNNKKIY